MPAARTANGDYLLPIPGAGNPATMLDFRRRVWECHVCYTIGNWGPGWQYYGLIDEPEIVVCSNDCKLKAIQDGKWPDGV